MRMRTFVRRPGTLASCSRAGIVALLAVALGLGMPAGVLAQASVTPADTLGAASSPARLEHIQQAFRSARQVRITLGDRVRVVEWARADRNGVTCLRPGGQGLTDSGPGERLSWDEVRAIDVRGSNRALGAVTGGLTGMVGGFALGALIGYATVGGKVSDERALGIPAAAIAVGFFGLLAGTAVGAEGKVTPRVWKRVHPEAPQAVGAESDAGGR